MNIVAVLAHPDDEAFALSGTIKRLTQAGHRVAFIETTDGSEGQLHPSLEWMLKEMGTVKAIRKKELENSAKILGVSQIYYLEYGDGLLNNKMIFDNELVNSIKKYLKQEEAEVVLAYDHTGISYHLDHIATSLATSKACYELTDAVDKLFLFARDPIFSQSLKISYPYLSPTNPVLTHTVDVSTLIEIKKQAVMAHQSQRSDWERFFKNNDLKEWAHEDYTLTADRGRNEEIFKIFRPL